MNVKCFKWGTSLLLLLFTSGWVYAQNKYILPQLSPKSPNAAEYEKYGDIPVSLTSGTVNVSIPLYTIKTGSLEIPITLSYNSNGLKTDEIPSYVGMGWSINAGGVINYEQRSLPDYSFGGGPGMFVEGSGYGPLDSLKLFLKNKMTPQRANHYLQMVAEGEIDGEFDFYNFSFPGYSGSFYLDTNQKIINVPKSNLLIKRVDNNLYTILDEKGNKWSFGVADYNESGPVPDVGVQLRQSFNENASIYLHNVTTNENRSVSFGYAASPFSYVTTQKSVEVMSDKPNAACPGSRINTSRTNVSLSNHMLTEIVFDGGKILLELSTENREDIKKLNQYALVPYLKKVKIYNAENKLISEYTFNYTNGNRLRLDEVVRTDTSGSPARWAFSYLGGNNYPVLMHRGKDHWGFYNGGSPNGDIPYANYASLVPGWQGNSTTTNKEADFDQGKLGVLEKITYPTGGSSVFSYEPNSVVFTSAGQLSSRPFFAQAGAGGWYETVYLVNENTQNEGQDYIEGTFTLTEVTNLYIDAYRWYKPLSQVNSLVRMYRGTSTYNIFGYEWRWECTPFACGIQKRPAEMGPGTYRYYLHKYADDSGFWLDGLASLRISKRVYNQGGDYEQYYRLGGCRIASIQHIDSVGNATMKRYFYNARYDKIGYFNTPNYISRMSVSYAEPACVNCGTKSTISEESVAPLSGPPVEYLDVTEYTDVNGANGSTQYTFTGNTNINGGSAPYLSPFKTNWEAGLLLNKKQYKNTTEGSYLVQLDSTAHETVAINDGLTRGIKAEYDNYCSSEGLGNRSFSYQLPTFYTEQFNTKSQSQVYYDNTGNISQTAENIFGSTKHTLPTETRTTGSDGELLKEKIKYSFDFDTTVITGNEAKAIRLLQRKNILVPIEKVLVKTIGGAEYVTKSTLFTFKADTAAVDKVFELLLTSPVAISGFTNSTITAGNLTKDNRYEESARFVKYDNNLNVLQMQSSNNINTAYIWDYSQQNPVCEVVDAAHMEIAYSSFETINHGSWAITGAALDSSVAFTGRRCLNPNAGNLVKSNLINGKQYILSYWSRTGAKTVAGATGTIKTGITIKGWTYYEHLLTTSSTSITLTGTGLMDELRLYPAAAQMNTFTYAPLIGITSQCDARNNVAYFEYDPIGRLKHIRDIDGNILKKFEYLYHSAAGLQSAWTTTGNTRCKSCAQGPLYFTNIQEREEQDTNPESATYQQVRWVETGVNSSCVPAVWQNTATALRCKLNSNYQNTGEQEQEQKDMNPCSSTYKQTRWIVTGTNTTACPIPVACAMNVNCWGPDQKCIGGSCETGVKVYMGTFNYDPNTGWYKCYYRYEFSNGTWSGTYFEWSEEMCPI